MSQSAPPPPASSWPFPFPCPADNPKPIVVQKYGGSSVADPARLQQVAARVAETVRRGCRVVVVVSAMGKTTDQLLELSRAISKNPSRRELDMLLSSGERIAMALLAMALGELGLDAISFTGSQSGILTNDRHSGARIIEVRPVRIQDELERERVVIVAGFQGMSYKREVTTLGRGGSDTTAVALAAALGAVCCEIYSDVDGVYSADPRLVPEAHRLEHIGYAEMQELAGHGAKVLGAQAVEWAQRTGIVIHARRTAGSPHETVVGKAAGSYRSAGRATAVTSSTRVIELSSTRRGGAVLAALAEEGVTLRHSALACVPDAADAEDGTLDASLVRDDLPDWPRTLARLNAAADGHLLLREHHGTVTAVGPGLGSDPTVLTTLRRELSAAGFHLARITSGPLRISLFLPSEEVAAATALVHALLCAPALQTVRQPDAA